MGIEGNKNTAEDGGVKWAMAEIEKITKKIKGREIKISVFLFYYKSARKTTQSEKKYRSSRYQNGY